MPPNLIPTPGLYVAWVVSVLQGSAVGFFRCSALLWPCVWDAGDGMCRYGYPAESQCPDQVNITGPITTPVAPPGMAFERREPIQPRRLFLVGAELELSPELLDDPCDWQVVRWGRRTTHLSNYVPLHVANGLLWRAALEASA